MWTDMAEVIASFLRQYDSTENIFFAITVKNTKIASRRAWDEIFNRKLNFQWFLSFIPTCKK
jgi:hypothetical protein